jgi:uncharacterized membrane protein YkvA (DUF1232 family)
LHRGVTDVIEWLRKRARSLKDNLGMLYRAYRNARTPLAAKVVVVLVLAYALSPIDLIPDFVPVLGYLDDLLLLPAGIVLAIHLIPLHLRQEYFALSHESPEEGVSLGRVGVALVVLAWLILGFAAARMLWAWIGTA